MNRLALVLFAVATAGCASRHRAPQPDQPWMTLAEYAARGAEKGRPAPVVSVPEGAMLRLKVMPVLSPHSLMQLKLEREIFTQMGDVIVSVQAKRPFHLDLMHLYASADGITWEPMWLGSGFFAPRVSELTVSADGCPETKIPAETSCMIFVEPAGSTR